MRRNPRLNDQTAIVPAGEIIDVFSAEGLKQPARAKMRVMVKRILKRYGYPPDLEEEAVRKVLQQAELLCANWV